VTLASLVDDLMHNLVTLASLVDDLVHNLVTLASLVDDLLHNLVTLALFLTILPRFRVDEQHILDLFLNLLEAMLRVTALLK
jgi:hypothetical protein